MLITYYLILYTTLYTLLDADFVVGNKRKCSKQSDCFYKDAEPCAICVDDSDAEDGTGQCVEIYPREYISSPACVRYNNSNCPLNCGTGLCTHYYNSYSPYCLCRDEEYYGETCQYKNSDGSARLVSGKKKFEGMVPACETTYLRFTFVSFNIKIRDRKVDIYVKIEGLTFRTFSRPYFRYVTKVENYIATVVLKTVFPYKGVGKLYKFGDKLIGYNTTVYIFVYIDGELDYKNTWNVFVKFDYLKCFPVISTTNCAENMDLPAVFLRGNALQVDINVDYIADGARASGSTKDPKCDVDEKMTWKLWRLHDGTSLDIPIYENYTRSRRIHFNPFELEFGVYQVELTVTNDGSNRPVSNTNYCYIKVACIPLVARVSGGSDRLVSPNIALLLRADSSYDPNMPPNDQDHINIDWSCINVNSPGKYESMCEVISLPRSKSYQTPPEALTKGGIYNFTVKVWTNRYDQVTGCDKIVSPTFTHFTVEVSNDNQLGNVIIECLDNCGAKLVPNYELYLKAMQPFIRNGESWAAYEWSFYKHEDKKEEFAESIKVSGVRSDLLIVRENALEYGSSYTIVARVKDSPWYAKYSLETYNIDFDVICDEVNPTIGKKGFTQFNIQCTVHKNLYDESLTFEFYDKNDEEVKEGYIFSGRMLGTSKEGKLHNVRLTRGNVMIYILNQYGLYLNKTIKVTLDEWLIDYSILNELYQNISNEMRFGSVPSTLASISFIPDIIPAAMDKNKSDILNTLLSFVTEMTFHDIGDMKLCASTLTNVLLTLNKPIQLQLKPRYIAATVKTINDLTKVFSEKIVSGEVQNMNSKEVKHVSVGILNCLEKGLSSRDSQTENIQEGAVDIFVEHQLQLASFHAEAVIETIAKTLCYVQVPGQPATKLLSRNGIFTVWVMENDDSYTIPKMIEDQNGIPIQFSDDLYNRTLIGLNKNENIALQVFTINDNIFWWSLSDVRSKLVSVSLNRKYKKIRISPIDYIESPMTVVLNVDEELKKIKLQGSASMPDSKTDSVNLDLAVKIHRFDISPRSLLTVKFIYPPTKSSLRIFVMDNFRPDYDIVMSNGITIDENLPAYDVSYYDYDEPYFLYMGVLPGSEVSVNQSVTYDFEIQVKVCKIWIGGQWSSAGCKIVKAESDKQVHCTCTHFSIFAAAFPVPPNAIDPFGDAKLFLTVIDNPIVVGFVLSILLIYILLCLCIWRIDKNIKTRRNVIVLEDNFSHDKAPYLIAVYTSSRLNAGTSANVALKLIGSVANSRSHVLACSFRSVLQRNSDDWFLVYCPQPLGDVQGLHIWHDNSGSSPEWLCDKIFVYDLIQDTETLFIVDEWLSLNENEYPEAYVLSAAIDDIISVKSLFVNNIILGLRENHIFLSCISSHPRSDFPRLQRLSIFMSSFMVAMLCSIMFYLPPGERIYVDEYGYSIGTRQLYVGVQTLIISVVVGFMVYSLFKKSHKSTYVRRKTILRVRESSTKGTSAIYSYDKKLTNSIGGNVYKNFVRIVSKTVKSNPMDPVQLPNSTPVTEVKRFWLILSWSVCISIIGLSSYLVMIYGLKLGFVRSKEWLSSLLIAIGGEILIFAPIRIVLLSSILAIAFLKLYDLSLHEVTSKDLKLVQIPTTIKYNIEVLRRRKQNMYKPLNKEQRDKILQSIERKRKRYTIADFVISILTLVVFHNLIYQLWTMNFHTNTHVVQMMTETKHEVIENVDFSYIHDIPSLNKYLQYQFVSVLYNLRWYNQKLFQPDTTTSAREYWASDITHRILGLPVIRQLRVVSVRCDNLVFNKGNCVPPWSVASEDQDDYGERWKPATWSDIVKSNSPWQYTDDPGNIIVDNYNLYGPSGVRYIAGGYTQVLGPGRRDTELRLAELREDEWLDGRTRAVFIEFSMYNVNEDVFVKVTLMVEFLISGTALPKGQSLAFKTGKYLSIWNILFVALIVFYLFRCVQLINRQGITQFISQFNNVCRLMILCLGIVSLIMFPIHYYVSTKYSETFHREGLDTYFDFNTLVLYYMLLRYVLSVLCCIAILHTIALLKSSRTLVRHYHTFVVSLSWITWLTIVTVVNIVALFIISSLCNIPGRYDVKKITVIEKSLEDLQPQELQFFSVKMFAIIKVLSIGLWLWCFVIMFLFYSKLAKSNKYRWLQ